MTDAAPKRVLILDDSPIVLEAVEQALLAAGYLALPAADLAGLERRLLERPDLLIIDVNMPEAYGDDVGAMLREMRGMSVPILLFSALEETELAARAREGGFDGYVVKDAGMGPLLAKVRALLAR
jgi:two-component system, OmpR family, phosphate regulon response regulator OmpR